MNSGLSEKLAKLKTITFSMGVKAVLIEKQKNIAWLLRGRSHVGIASEDGVCSLLFNQDGLYLIVNNIEGERLLAEEFFEPDLLVREYPWYDFEAYNRIIRELSENSFITDAQIEDKLRPLRLEFIETEIDDLRNIGFELGEIMEANCFSIKPGMSELAISALQARNCLERNLEPLINLVAVDERVFLYRHPLPTKKVLVNYAMLVLGVRRYGLFCGITRFVSFTWVTAELGRKKDAIVNINTAVVANTRPGAAANKVFQLLVKAYAKNGFPEEWKQHHQGGPVGYSSREYKITDETNFTILAGQAYAWNPSIAGFKAEDTYLINKENNELMTPTLNLPSIKKEANGQIIVTADILRRNKYY